MKKVLLLAAAVLTLGTATAQLGLNGTFGKPVSNALHKVLDAVKLNTQDIPEAKANRAVLVGSTTEMKAVAKDVKPAFNGIAAPMMQISAEELIMAPAKAEVAKKLAAKAPAAMLQEYTGNCSAYSGGSWKATDPWTMATASAGGSDYMFDVIPDLPGFGEAISYYANGVFVEYTSTDNGDGTTAITIAPQWIASTSSHDIFLCDYSSTKKGGDGSILMTLDANGNLTLNAPNNTIGYFATPINTEVADDEFPPFVPANIAGAYEQCGGVTYTIPAPPAPDTFVAETVYTGKGYDKGETTNVTWQMQMGKKEGVNVIRDLVPSIAGDTGIPTDVEYTLDGNKITIQPQKVGMYKSYHLYLFDWDSADGTIILTKDAQGHITTPENLNLVVGAFATDAYTSDYSSDDYLGYWTRTEGVVYYAEDQEIPNPAPVVMYEPETVSLHVGISEKGYMLANTFIILPGYAEISYRNTTADEVTSWSWEICDSIYNTETKTYDAGTPITGTGKNFSFLTEGFAEFGTPVLTGANGELVSTPYAWGAGNEEDGPCLVYQTVGDLIQNWSTANAGQYTATVCNPANSIAYYGALGTPDVNANGLNISTIYAYQGKPAAPLFITGLNLAVKNFTAQSDFNFTARIVKATRSATGRITFGQTIAYADASAESVTIESTSNGTFALINFNDMYVLDEDEMSQTIDHLFIDEEFAVVFDGWNNGTFSCMPFGEYFYNTNGFSNILFEQAAEPGSLYSFTNNYKHLCVGFNEAAYGYLHTTSATNFTALADGEEFTISVDDAMLYSESNITGAKSPRVFVSDDCPEWITLTTGNANESATAFDIKVTVEKNEGDAREAKFYVYQEGAKIDITVSQTGNTGAGINGVTVNEASAPRYNMAGQRVNENAKGIVISNGKKQIAK